MPLFTEDIHDNSQLQSKPVPTEPYTGPVQQPNIPSYFQPGTPGGGENKPLGYDNIVQNLTGINEGKPESPDSQVSNATLTANKRFGIYRPGVNFEDIYSQAQSGWDRVGNSGAQFVNKFGSYLLQTVGFIGGAIGAAAGGLINYGNKKFGGDGKVVENGNAVSLMSDNFLTQLGDVWKEGAQDAFPIYKSNKYSNGNIWDKLQTSSWWLDDFVDRLALTASMIVPGILEAKGLGLFGTIAREGGAIEATGIGSKAIKVMADHPEMYGKLGKVLSNAVYKTAGEGGINLTGEAAINFKKIVRGAQQMELISFNTIGQNALNGRESQTAIKKSLQEQNAQGLTHYSEAEIEEMSAKGALESFWYNMPLTLMSSVFELPQIFSSMKGGMSLLKKMGVVNTSEEFLQGLENLAGQTVKPTLGKTIRTALFTGLEHGQLESSQVAFDRYIQNAIAGTVQDGKIVKDTDDPLTGSFKEYINNFSDPNGQNNIALGTIQGLLMTVFGRAYKGYKGDFAKEDKVNKDFLTNLNESYSKYRFFNGIENMMERDDKGNVIIENGKVKLDQNKLSQLGVGFVSHIKDYEDRILAIANGDKTAIEQMNYNSLAQMSQNFFQDSNGKDYLTNILRFEYNNQTKNPDRLNDITNGVDNTPANQLQESLQHVDNLYKLYNNIEQRQAGFLNLDVNYKDKSEADKATVFTEKHKATQFDEGANQIFYNNKLQKNNIELGSLGITEKSLDPKTDAEIRGNEILDENDKLRTYLDESREIYKKSIDRPTINTAWIQERDNYRQLIKSVETDKSTKNIIKSGEKHPTSVSINSKSGDEDLQVGTQYYANRQVEVNEKPGVVSKFTSFTVLGENENGVIIKTNDDKNITVPKDKFSDIILGKVEDTDKYPNAKFYIESSNNIFTYNIGKKENNPTGNITYDSKTDKLYFESLDGKFKRQVTRDQFSPKEGYNVAQIYFNKTFTQKAQDALTEAVPINEKLATRNKIISDLYNTSKERLVQVNKELDEHQKALIKNTEALNNLEKTKEGKPKKSVIKNANKTIKELSDIKTSIQNKITDLEKEKEELQTVLPYFQDLVENQGELPQEGKELLSQLKENVSTLKELIDNTSEAIQKGNSILETIEGALKNAFKFLDDIIKGIKSANPLLPLSISELEDQLVKFYGEEGTKEFIEQKLGWTQNVLDLQEQLLLTEEDLKIPDMQDKANKLATQLEELNKGLKDLQGEYLTKEKILQAFQQYAEKVKQEKIEEDKLIKNKQLLQQFLGTHTQSVFPDFSEKVYEPLSKKDDLKVVTGTIPIDDGKPHQERANNFGYRFPSMKNRDSIQGMIVTENTENEVLPGLIKHLGGFKGVIALVMCRTENGKFILVDERGEDIVENIDKINSAIYQVFPEKTLENSKGSLFRDSTSDEMKKSLTEQYGKWREQVLKETTPRPAQSINTSFGIPEFITKTDDKGKEVRDTVARTSAEETGFVSTADLKNSNIVRIATTNNSISNGSVTFNTPLGRVFLNVPGGMIKLFNKHLSTDKANTIYDAIHQLSVNARDLGNIKNEQSQKLINWLKSVVYWGIPKTPEKEAKDAGYNSVYFVNVLEGEHIVPKLFISGKGQSFTFTPTELETNKEAIITLLQNMYHNAHADLLNDKNYNQPYYEITSLDEKGNPNVKTWDNYQTYLLSSKDRKIDEIPFTTNIRALKNKNDVNRKHIYFTLTNEAENYTIPTPKIEKKIEIETKPASNLFSLDGKTENIIENPALGKIIFLAKEDGTVSFPKNEDGNIREDAMEAITKLSDQKNISLEDARGTLAKSIINKIMPQVEAAKIAIEAPITPLTTEEEDSWNNRAKFTQDDDEAYRLELNKEIEKFQPENWTEVENFLKNSFPNVPVYRVKNIIQATNGRQAWGMLKNGAIYLYENAEVGTVYHEVFEGVWKMFATPEEKTSILNEFKSRKGSFINSFTGESTKYSEATDKDIKEQLAEEFRDYIRNNKVPEKSGIAKLFADIWSFIKEFFTGSSATTNTDTLFKKIGEGYYKQYAPYDSKLSYAKTGVIDVDSAIPTSDTDFRIANIPSTQVHEIMQHMTYSTLVDITKNGESLFNIIKLNKTDQYAKLKEEIKGLIGHQGDMIEQSLANKEITPKQAEVRYNNIKSLYVNIDKEWNDIVKQHETYLKTYSIEFDENDETTLRNENNSGKSDYQDARKIDGFRKSNSAIKLLIGTLPVTITNSDGKVVIKKSSIGGSILVPSDKTYIQLMDALHDSLGIEDMFKNLQNLAKNDSNYQALYNRLVKTKSYTDGLNTDNIKSAHNLQLIGAFWKAFKKQQPDVKVVYVLPDGETIVGDANLSSAAKQAKDDLFNDFVSSIRSNNPYISYDEKKREYSVTPALAKYTLSSGNISTYTSFLKTIGIEFTPKELNKLTNNQLNKFKEAVEGIKSSIATYKGLKGLVKQTLSVDGRMLELGSIRAILSHPEFESTYFNINGERVQTYIGTNAMNNLWNVLSKVKNLNELSDTRYAYLLTDEFSKGSSILSRIFDLETGDKINNSENLLKTGYIGGIVDEQKGRKKETSITTYKERLIMELNLNIEGYYLNLIPGDASIEWMAKMGNPISEKMLSYGYNEVNEIFKNYFISEIGLSRDSRAVKQGGSKDLRFFKDLLGDEINNEIKKSNNPTEKLYTRYSTEINKSVKNLIEEKTNNLRHLLENYGVITHGEKGLEVEGLSFSKEENISEEDLMRNLKTLQTNYMIANIEYHKVLYGDPYQYEDEMKRIKSFNSPREDLMGDSPFISQALDNIYNKGFNKGDLGWTDFSRNYFRSSALEDKLSTSDLKDYGIFKETDGGGMMSIKAYRSYRLRLGDWSDENERQFRHDVEFTKLVKSGASKEDVLAFEENNPNIRSTYTPLKPIVSGNRDDGQNYNSIILDKLALIPLSFRIAYKLNPESNMVKFIDKLEKEDTDYTPFDSSRKVGSGELTSLYNNDGLFNEEPFKETNNIPFSIISSQTEVPSKDNNQVRTGSQLTKLATMDFMNAGVPIDYKGNNWEAETDKETVSPIYKEIQHNQELKEALIENGYNTLLNRLSIEKTEEGFKINDIDKLVNTLRDEILRRETNDNIIDSFEGFRKGDVILEATPSYQQIRNILYSIADKQVVRPSISGGLKVQIPSALLESNNIVKEIVNGKPVFTNNTLSFYKDEDGKRICGIMVGRWFKSDKSDEELLNYLNNTDEGKKLLEGIGFRIPTQKQNSIDVFRVEKFLPSEFGDSVVVPSELVKKAGSDFDIDKLSLYLKNSFKNGKGFPVAVPYFGIGEKAKESINKFLLEEDLKYMMNGDETYVSDKIEDDYGVLADRVYKKSLENEYIQSLQNLTSHPLNFDKLTTPNSAKEMSDLSKEIVKAIGEKQFDYSSLGNILDREAMSSLRHAFVSSKRMIAIAATSQTNHAQNQRTSIYVDVEKLKNENMNATDKKYLGDGEIRFGKYNSVIVNNKKVPSLSMIKSQDGKYISDRISQFTDGALDVTKEGPWLIKMGATYNTIGTWLFLNKIGVPIEDVGYFINQPIIREFLQTIDSKGGSYLFNQRIINDTLDEYKNTQNIKDLTEIPTLTQLKKTVGKDVKDMTESEKVYQQFMLNEFLKYAKMAEHLFKVQQASSFDTANINDPYLLDKKEQQIENARNTIISSVDDLINSSFVGKLRTTFTGIRDAYATVLTSDKPSIRSVMKAVLAPYTDVNDRDFVKIARKAVNDVFDWAVQTNEGLNTEISDLLLGKNKKAVADRVMDFVNKVKQNPDHPLSNNVIINSIRRVSSEKEGTPINLNILGKNKVYDQNQVIYGFNELKKYLNSQETTLYDDIIKLSILQSGLSNSSISFTSLIPYEDFKSKYNEVLFALEKMSNLQEFHQLNVFQRNNWADRDIVPFKRAETIKSKQGKWLNNIGMMFINKGLVKAMEKNQIPKVLNISPFSKEGQSEFISYSWDSNISKKDKAEMRKKGDYSYINKGLFKRVNDGNGNPIIQTSEYKGKIYTNYVYKAINAWGAGVKANEFYNKLEPMNDDSSLGQQSVIDNGFIKVREVEDGIIEKYMTINKDEDVLKQNISQNIKRTTIQMQPDNIKKLLDGTKTTTTRSESQAKQINIPIKQSAITNLGGKDFKITNRGLLTVEEAGGRKSMEKSENFENNIPKYQQTKDWLQGKGKLYVYDFEPLLEKQKENKDLNCGLALF